MALFIRQSEDRSKLQEKLAAELREKAKARSQMDTTPPDGVTDMNYLKDTKTTTSLAWIWIVVVLVGLAALIVYIIGSAR